MLDHPEALPGYRNLAAEVLRLAIEDLRDPFARDRARRWIFEPDPDFCETWCELAGVDVVRYREWARLIHLN